MSSVAQLDDARRRRHPQQEPWLRKAQIAAHLGFSTRWVEKRVQDGMPSEKWGGERRFRISLVEDWLRHHYDQRRCS